MTINKFIKICSKKETPVGEFAKDIVENGDFPYIQSDEEVLELLEKRASLLGQTKHFITFKKNFLDQGN